MHESTPDQKSRGHGLTDEEHAQLAAFLDARPRAMNLEALDGFLAALVAGPQLVLPSRFLPLILGDADEGAFASQSEAAEIVSLLMRHWNSIADDLARDGVYEPFVFEVSGAGIEAETETEAGADVSQTVASNSVLGRDWARGFMRGVREDSAPWSALFGAEDEGALFTIPLVAGEVDPDWPANPLSSEQNEQLHRYMAAGLARAYRHFKSVRQTTGALGSPRATPHRSRPKVGRNDPCPCGSGNKHKHCCGDRVAADQGAPTRPSFVQRPEPAPVVVSVAWFEPDEWEKLVAVSPDRSALDDTYEQWCRGAEAAIAQLEQRGQHVRREPITVAAFLVWCSEHERAPDSAARAAYVAELARRRAMN